MHLSISLSSCRVGRFFAIKVQLKSAEEYFFFLAGGSDSGPPTESFGSMTAQSGITDDMLDSLIALKDFGNIEGLPPLDVILGQDDEIEKKAKRRELERQKQMELQSMRVKTVDEYGRAYATGRRKASIARVWLKEGEGKIIINGLPHDLYFPDIDQRLQLLEPFYQTKTLGLFDIRSTVKGGGITGIYCKSCFN